MRGARIVDIALTVFFFGIGILAIVGVEGFPFQDQLFPYVASALILGCIFIYVIQQILFGATMMDEEQGPSATRPPFSREQLSTVWPLAGAIILLVAAVFLVGHLIAVPAFVFMYVRLRGEKLWIAAAAASLLFLFIWGLLIKVMEVALPRPFLADWLNL